MNEHLVLNIEMKWLGQETCEKIFRIILSPWSETHKNHTEIHLTPMRRAIKKEMSDTNAGENLRRKELLHTPDRGIYAIN